jgi:hypothetical protein
MSYPPPPPLPPPPPPPGAWGPSPPNSGKAIAALVLGILGIVSCQVLGIAAIVLGQQANQEIAASGGQVGGEGFAKAGIIMGWVAVALLALGVLGFVVFLVFAAAFS